MPGLYPNLENLNNEIKTEKTNDDFLGIEPVNFQPMNYEKEIKKIHARLETLEKKLEKFKVPKKKKT